VRFELFDRFCTLQVYETQVSKTPTGQLQIAQTDLSGTEYSSKQPDGSPGFRIRFSIDKTREGTPNSTSLHIYNLNEQSRRRFERLYSIVVLKAGYESNAEVIFRGNVSRTITTKEGPDYITAIEAMDGLFSYQNLRTDISYRPGTLKNQAYQTLTEAFAGAGIGKGEIRGIPTDGYNQGLVLTGSAVDSIRKLCEQDGLAFSIQDGRLTILPKDGSSSDEIVVVSPDSGLIGTPHLRDTGITIKSLMNPKIRPWGKVSVLSKFLFNPKDNQNIPGGVYTAIKVTHSGDTFGGDWFTTVEAV
jgi:hypothetical protein